MDKITFNRIVEYVLQENDGFIHDSSHSVRVTNLAYRIAKTFEVVDMDVLIASCLLHDIGRIKQGNDCSICHAEEGGKMAYDFLQTLGWSREKCMKVRECIVSHRYKSAVMPRTIEAKILYDADKLDMTGAIGIARVLLYKGYMKKSIYNSKDKDSFLNEYRDRLLRVYDSFYTEEARKIADNRKALTHLFYQDIIDNDSLNSVDDILPFQE